MLSDILQYWSNWINLDRQSLQAKETETWRQMLPTFWSGLEHSGSETVSDTEAGCNDGSCCHSAVGLTTKHTQTNTQIHRQTDSAVGLTTKHTQTNTQIHRQTDRQTDRQVSYPGTCTHTRKIQEVLTSGGQLVRDVHADNFTYFGQGVLAVFCIHHDDWHIACSGNTSHLQCSGNSRYKHNQ